MSDTHTLDDETRYRFFKILNERPDISQREMARELGVSVGKINYCLNALIRKGWVKARNFRNSSNKAAYAYYLTAKGVEEKVRVTYEFLRRRIAEYDLLQQEIESLTSEVRRNENEAAIGAPQS